MSSLSQALVTGKPTRQQRELIWEAIGYTPWPEAEAFHFDTTEDGQDRRHKFMTGGEQAGKSLSGSAEAFSRMLWGRLFWIVGPDFAQTHNEFDYIEGWAQALGLWESTNKPDKGSWRMKWLTGQTIITKSAKDVATLAGAAPDGVLFVEAAQAQYEAFLRCYGRTAPRKGWLLINGTFEKENSAGWFRDLWKKWQGDNPHGGKSFNLPSWCNTEFYPGGLENPEIKGLRGSMAEEHFQERFGGIPSKPLGVVHPEFDHTLHVRKVVRRGTVAMWEKDPDLTVFGEDGTVYLPTDTVDEVWIDPGFRHAYAALFVTVWQGVAVQYHEMYKHGWDSEKMATEAMKHERWGNVGRLIIDVSGKGHAGGNRSAADIWYRQTRLHPLARMVPVLDGVERVRVCLTPNPENGLPQLILDPSCTNTAWELSDGYKYPTDSLGNPLPTDKPEDKNNDAVKALVYGLTINFGRAFRDQRTRAKARSEGSARERTSSGFEALYGAGEYFGVTDTDYDDSWEEDSRQDEE